MGKRSPDRQSPPRREHSPATIVVGLGNDLLSDDGAGIQIARRLRERLDPARFAVCDLTTGGMGLVDHLVGYRRAVLIDACRTGRVPPGTLTRHDAASFSNSLRLASFHAIAFPDAIELARKMGADLPERIDVFAIEVADVETVAETCTPRVQASLPAAVEEIARFLEADAALWATQARRMRLI